MVKTCAIWICVLISPLGPNSQGSAVLTFQKGYDPRRYSPENVGLVEYHKKLKAMLREQSLEACDFMLETMRNDKAALKLRLVAAKEILDRGLGRPIDVVQVEAQGGADAKSVNDMSEEQLLTIVNQAAKGITIDHDN
jgi:hypothetical protein